MFSTTSNINDMIFAVSLLILVGTFMRIKRFETRDPQIRRIPTFGHEKVAAYMRTITVCC